jgi:hypothetical protein
MPIEKSLVPDVYPGTVRPVYRVEGDRPYATYPTKAEAEQRETELVADND